MIRYPAMGVNFLIYQERILKYQPTFDGMIEDFNDEIFGEYTNRISKDEFIGNLTSQGWKYFSFNNLKELFSIGLQKYGMLENVEIDLPQFEKGEDNESIELDRSFNFRNSRSKSQSMAPAYITPTLSDREELIKDPEA